MGIAMGSRKMKSPAAVAGRVVLFYAAFIALVRDSAEWPHIAINILLPGRKPT